jgi:glycosyltransferase involved in cell wall biosynthesis
MKIIIFSSLDSRSRHKFISEPLKLSGHNVEIIRTAPLLKYLLWTFSLFHKRRNTDLVIFIGLGLKELFAYMIIRFFCIKTIVRMGGDQIRDLDSVSITLFGKKHYIKWVKCRINMVVVGFFLKQVKNLIVVNEALVSRLKNKIHEQHNIFVLPQFCEGFSQKHDYSLSSPVELLTVVNLRFSEKVNGVKWLISQLVEFVENNDVLIRYRVVGAGLNLEKLQAFVNTVKLPNKLTIELVGHIDDLDHYYACSDVFLYCSSHDGTPNVILESKLAGLPLLANDCEEFRSIVTHGKSGFLFQSPRQFMEMLSELITNIELRKKTGQEATKECAQKFSLPVIQKNLDEIIFKVRSN